MSEYYTIISSIFLAVTSVLFFVKWRFEARENEEYQFNAELEGILNDASLGGYYYWNKEAGNEVFSLNLIKLFNLHKKTKTFEEFTKLLGTGEKRLVSLTEKLKSGEQENFLFTSKVMIAGNDCHIKYIGNTIYDYDKGISGIVVWFYDISEYITQIKVLTSQSKAANKEALEYSSILNSMPIPIWRRDKDFNIKYCNQAYTNFVDEKSSKHSHSKINELDENLASMSKIALSKKRPLHMKKHLISEGKRRLFELNENAIKNIPGVAGFAYDITAQENMEKELARHISAHSDLLESSSSAMAIYGQKKKLRFYNNAFVKLWDLDEKWLDTGPTYNEVLQLLREQRKLPEQADFKDFRNDQLKLFNDLIDPHNEFFHLPDGKALRVIVIPHALGGLLFAYEDMTDRLATERSYNTLVAVQKETLDNLREGVAVFGPDGILKLYNPVYTKMWPDEKNLLNKNPHSDELVERSKHLFNYGDDWDGFKATLRKRPETNKPLLIRLERTDGVILDKLVVPLPDGNFLLSYEDVTDSVLAEKILRERNEALEEADKLKTEFLANVSYELRTPLTSISGFSEVLGMETFGDLNKEQKEYVKGIHNSSQQLTILIDDILDLASVEAGYMVLDVKEFSVFDLLSSTIETFKDTCKKKKLDISLECTKNLGNILGDEKRIQHIISNIIDNSVKFTNSGGEITVNASPHKNDEIVISIEDTGVGIPKEERNKIFDRFFKTEEALSKKKSGTGLGLSVAKSVAKLHGGRIEVTSDKGKGTKVMCYFKKKNSKLLNPTKKPALA